MKKTVFIIALMVSLCSFTKSGDPKPTSNSSLPNKYQNSIDVYAANTMSDGSYTVTMTGDYTTYNSGTLLGNSSGDGTVDYETVGGSVIIKTTCNVLPTVSAKTYIIVDGVLYVSRPINTAGASWTVIVPASAIVHYIYVIMQ